MTGDTNVLSKIVVFSKPSNCEGQMRLKALSEKLERLLEESQKLHEEKGVASPELLNKARVVYAQIAQL